MRLVDEIGVRFGEIEVRLRRDWGEIEVILGEISR